MEHDFQIGDVFLGIVPQKEENNQFESILSVQL
jgi:hypothetical protein